MTYRLNRSRVGARPIYTPVRAELRAPVLPSFLLEADGRRLPELRLRDAAPSGTAWSQRGSVDAARRFGFLRASAFEISAREPSVGCPQSTFEHQPKVKLKDSGRVPYRGTPTFGGTSPAD